MLRKTALTDGSESDQPARDRAPDALDVVAIVVATAVGANRARTRASPITPSSREIPEEGRSCVTAGEGSSRTEIPAFAEALEPARAGGRPHDHIVGRGIAAAAGEHHAEEYSGRCKRHSHARSLPLQARARVAPRGTFPNTGPGERMNDSRLWCVWIARSRCGTRSRLDRRDGRTCAEGR